MFFFCQFLIPDFWIEFLISMYGHVWNKQPLNSRTFSVVATSGTFKIRISSVYIWHSLYTLCCSELARPGPKKWSGPARPGPTKGVPEHTPTLDLVTRGAAPGHTGSYSSFFFLYKLFKMYFFRKIEKVLRCLKCNVLLLKRKAKSHKTTKRKHVII